jgi:TolB-like protein/tetratricopeptide (TPR) repeat protein
MIPTDWGTMIGKTVSHYRITRELGAGGMGVVYEAVDTRLDRTVALKFLPPQTTSDPVAKARFVHEAKAAAALGHPNICTIHEIDEFEGQSFIAMECCEGETLKEKIAKGPMKFDETLDIAKQMAQGLAKAHEQGIVHRDIKPANIFLTSDGLVKILDFGLATSSAAIKVTKTGTTLGTISYMSPEQARGLSADHRSDIWSFGVILYEILSGKPPFKGEYEQGIVYQILNQDHQPLDRLNLGLPVGLDLIVDKTLAKDPPDRYQSMAELREDLNSVEQRMENRKPEGTSGLSAPQPCIAVLPFVNMSADPEQEYFCDGMAEEIINVLTKVEGLRVVARTSAFFFKGKTQDVRVIGNNLNATVVLEGSVRKAGTQLRITAQLIGVEDGYHIWSESYDRRQEDVFAIQDEISEAIAEALKVRLVTKPKPVIEKDHHVDFEAYNLYLKGRYLWNKRSEVGLKSAIDYFQQAIEVDPTYALPYSGVADCYIILAAFGFLSPREAIPCAKAAASRALEINETLGEAHTSLAFVLACYEWDWKGAEKEYKRAIELNPSYATTFQWYAYLLRNMGRGGDETIVASERAVELDPLSFPIVASSGYSYYALRQYDKAGEICLTVLEIEPEFTMARSILGMVYSQKGWPSKALDEWKLSAEFSNGAPEDMACLGLGYALAGMEEEARTILDEFNDRANQEYVPPCFFAMIHAGLDEKDRVIDWLNRAYEVHDYYLSYHLIDPMYDQMRDDARFADLMRRIGLDPSRFAPTAIE